jgi:hypothetical protein
MQKNTNFLLFVALFIVSSIPTFSQNFYVKGYIVEASGDTVKGLIRDESFFKLSQRIYFKKNGEKDVKSFLPTDIKGFYVSPDHYFESHPIFVWDFVLNSFPKKHTQTKFIRKLVSGKLSMYQYDAADNYESYYIKKDKGIQPLLLTAKKFNRENRDSHRLIDTFPSNEGLPIGDYVFGKEYLKTLAKVFSDWQNYKPSALELKKNVIRSEIVNYNKDVSPKTLKVLSKAKITMNVSGFYSILSNPEKGLLLERFLASRSQDPMATSNVSGYQYGVSFGNKTYAKGISLELGYAFQNRQLSGVNNDVTFNEKYNFNAKTSVYFFRVNYNILPASRISPYVSFGVGIGSFTLDAVSKVRYKINVDLETPYRYDNEGSTNQEMVALGLNLFLHKRHALKFEWSPKSYIQESTALISSIRLGYQFEIF